MQSRKSITAGQLISDFDLEEFNTFGISSVCKKFGVFTSANELSKLMNEATGSTYILGGGSNVLLPSRWDANVLHNRILGKKVVDHRPGSVRLRVGAGENWNALTRWCVEMEYGGIENLALIPGLVGAAPIQNIGAYGVELSDVLAGVYYFDFEKGKVVWLDAKDLELGYRDSIFKGKWKGKGCVLSIDLRLTTERHSIHTTYGSLQTVLDDQNIAQPGIGDVRDAVIQLRRSKLPDPGQLGNSGSFFKNPILDKVRVDSLRNEFPDLPSYAVDDRREKVPAGWLIDDCGWKGERRGNVGCYRKQALVLVNYGGATSEEVLEFAKHIKSSVHDRFGIQLEAEVNIVDQSLD